MNGNAQAEAAAGRGDHARAEAEFMEALAIEGASGVITSALWLQLCRSRLRLQKPEAAKEACGTAQARLPDDEDALVQKVWQPLNYSKPLTTAGPRA